MQPIQTHAHRETTYAIRIIPIQIGIQYLRVYNR